MNLTPRRLIAAAEEHVRAKLRRRPKAPLAASIEARESMQPHASIEAQAKELALIVGVDPDHLRPDDRLGDILCVGRDELPVDVQPLFQKFGLRDHIIVRGTEILDHVERRAGVDQAILNREPFVPAPRNEDEWMERVMGMTVEELLVTLA